MKDRYATGMVGGVWVVTFRKMHWPGIGIQMRPDVLQRKQRGAIAYWQFRQSLPDVSSGERLWVSIVPKKWAGYFVIKEWKEDTREITWNPMSWVAEERPWADDCTHSALAHSNCVFWDLRAIGYTVEVPATAEAVSKLRFW